MTVWLSRSLYFSVSSKSLHNISYQTLMEYRQGGRLDMLPPRINQLPLPNTNGTSRQEMKKISATFAIQR